jgi:hypothetical protein
MDAVLVSDEVRNLHVDVPNVSPYQPFLWLFRGVQDLRPHWGASLGYGALIVALGWTLLVF